MRRSNRSEPDIPFAAIAELAAATDLHAASTVIASRFHHLCANGEREAAPAAPSLLPSDRVGPWCRREDGGIVRFTREPGTLWGWSVAEEIPAKKTGRRVVFIGESVARAMMLDPLFNCAGALQSICNQAAGYGVIEIVDLAKNGMPPPQALELLESASLLDPDLYVVFAGNNLLTVNGVYDVRAAAAALKRAGSWRDVAQYARDATAQHARDFVTRLAAIARSQNVPLLYVVPAYNQRDWSPYEWWTNPLLTPAEQRECSRTLQEAERLLDEGAVAEAEAAARDVLRLEEDASPCALRLLARAALANHDVKRAADLFDAAAEALITLPVPALLLTTPRLSQVLREQCAAEGVPIVDLPRVLGDAQNGFPLGRELFLDHVHMSHLGVQHAMAAVAEGVLPLLGLAARSQSDLFALAPAPSADALAQAHFLSALFNAYYAQPLEVIRYHTERALEASPDIMAAMNVHVQRSVRPAPDLLCPGHDDVRALHERFTGIVWSLARPQWHWKRLHLGLLRLWTEILRERWASDLPSFDVALATHRGVGAAGVDLFDAQQPDGQPIGLPHRRTVLLTARDAESVFWFCWSRPSEWLHLRIMSRVPSAVAGKTVTLTVNDDIVRTWPSTTQWRAIDCVIAGAALKTGLNLLRVDWPDSAESRAERVDELAAFLTAGASSAITADRMMYSLRGEICLLSATATPTPTNVDAICWTIGAESASRV
jgi:hypothetical protein